MWLKQTLCLWHGTLISFSGHVFPCSQGTSEHQRHQFPPSHPAHHASQLDQRPAAEQTRLLTLPLLLILLVVHCQSAQDAPTHAQRPSLARGGRGGRGWGEGSVHRREGAGSATLCPVCERHQAEVKVCAIPASQQHGSPSEVCHSHLCTFQGVITYLV